MFIFSYNFLLPFKNFLLIKIKSKLQGKVIFFFQLNFNSDF